MTTGTDSEKWRKKYFDSLDKLDSEQQQFSALETALKRLISRLCTAALGQTPQLDEQVRKLQAVVRRESTTEELEKLTPALTDAIGAVDRPVAMTTIATATGSMPAQQVSPVVVDDQRVRSIWPPCSPSFGAIPS